MTKENEKTSLTDVMPTLAKFVSDANFEFDLASLPGEIEEINTLFMDTDYADTIETRRKMLRCKKFILDFCQAMSPFAYEQIDGATNDVRRSHV